MQNYIFNNKWDIDKLLSLWEVEVYAAEVLTISGEFPFVNIWIHYLF